ncbi:hypothetical protein J0S82_010969 [Galemys pyrenaicus]|uniref:Uncharacterized protein n=1 Tax=Galemys pyrenaicus TaxID=202257 RepID=A0A8J6DS83_GALPY|nr:hypothetical protein J0S82_010969 [Galemys pyrenaicus]
MDGGAKGQVTQGKGGFALSCPDEASTDTGYQEPPPGPRKLLLFFFLGLLLLLSLLGTALLVWKKRRDHSLRLQLAAQRSGEAQPLPGLCARPVCPPPAQAGREGSEAPLRLRYLHGMTLLMHDRCYAVTSHSEASSGSHCQLLSLAREAFIGSMSRPCLRWLPDCSGLCSSDMPGPRPRVEALLHRAPLLSEQHPDVVPLSQALQRRETEVYSCIQSQAGSPPSSQGLHSQEKPRSEEEDSEFNLIYENF